MFVNKQNNIKNRHGFTLLEMIGVLAVIAILSAIIAPNVIQQMNFAQQDAEEETLSRLADGLRNYVLSSRIIPVSGYGSSTWSGSIASQMDLPPIDIYRNTFTCDRRYWFDRATDLNGLTDASGSYDQNTAAVANLSGYTKNNTGAVASAPANPRAMIISDMTASCSNTINGVGDTAANFALVWNQANAGSDPLVEGAAIKIQRINLADLFETVTLNSVSTSNFVRKSYTNPLAAAPTVTYPLTTVEKNSHIFSISYSTGGFTPTDLTGGTASIDIGHTSGGGEFVSADMTTGTSSTYIPETPYTSTSDISVGVEMTVAGTLVVNASSGFIDIILNYQGEPQYKLEGRTGNPTTITNTTPGIPETVSFNVIKSTTLSLYDQSWTAGSPTGDLSISIIIKEDESFIYSPGPPALWGR